MQLERPDFSRRKRVDLAREGQHSYSLRWICANLANVGKVGGRLFTLALAYLAGCATSGNVEMISAQAGTVTYQVKCVSSTDDCVAAMKEHCPSGAETLGHTTNPGGALADALPGPFTWHHIVFACSSDVAPRAALTATVRTSARTSKQRAARDIEASEPKAEGGSFVPRASPAVQAGPTGAAPVVAVFDVVDAGNRFDSDTIEQLTEYLSVRVAELAGFRIVPREQLRERLVEEKGAGLSACFDQACQIELGKAMAAQKSLATKLLRVGSVCAITTTLYDLKSETAELAASAKTNCDDSGLIQGADEVAQEINARLRGRR